MDMLDQLGDENYGMIRLGEESDDVGHYGCTDKFDMYVERHPMVARVQRQQTTRLVLSSSHDIPHDPERNAL